MHFLTVLTCSLLPVLHDPLVQLVGLNNCLLRTTVSQQHNHLNHDLRIRPQLVEDRLFRHCKCLLAHIAEKPLFFIAVDIFQPCIPYMATNPSRFAILIFLANILNIGNIVVTPPVNPTRLVSCIDGARRPLDLLENL